MTDYMELVKELRFGAEYGCDYDLIERAAAAIEALQAEVAFYKKNGCANCVEFARMICQTRIIVRLRATECGLA